jgi:hypothetical protein
MADKLKVRVTRTLLHEGQAVPVGAILNLPAAVAMDYLDAGRSVLLDSADLPQAVRARREDVIAQTRRQGRLMPAPDGPWQHRN